MFPVKDFSAAISLLCHMNFMAKISTIKFVLCGYYRIYNITLLSTKLHDKNLYLLIDCNLELKSQFFYVK